MFWLEIRKLTFWYALLTKGLYVLSCIFRPQVLVLTGFPCVRPELLYFVNALTKKISLMVCGHIIVVSHHDFSYFVEKPLFKFLCTTSLLSYRD